MAASMVGYVAPAVVGAADATKGFAIKTYDINNPSSASGKSTITLDKTKDFADGDVVIPCAVYYSEATDNSTGSLLVSLTTDSKDIKMKLHDPTMEYTADELGYTLGGVSFETNCYISFAGYCKNKRTGYLPAGKYVFGEAESQPAANTNNYFIGCSWMNNGEDYHWAGELSDSYPFYVFDVKIPKTIDAGSYKITYCRYNTDATGVNDNPAPMVESGGERYTAEAGNLKLEELTINVKDGDTPITTTSTTTQKTTTSATTTAKPTGTTVTTKAPVLDGDINFEFVDENGNDTVKVKKGEATTIAVDVNINAGTNPISALDVQFKTTPGVKISEIYKSTKAFSGVSVSSNLAELRASYATLNGDEAMTAKNGKSAFMLDVDVPADTPEGIYYVDFADQCKIFKDNTSFNYKTASKPLKIVVGDPTPTQTSATTTAKPTGTTVTTKAPVLDGDINFKFVDENGESTVEVDPTKGATLAVDVNIEAGTNPISALDVQFKTSDGIKISEIYKSTKAFSGVSVSSNIAELRASYATLNGDEAMTAKNGKSAFMLDVDVPAGTPEGTYTVGFDSQCKIFKDNTSFNYKTDFTPLTIVVKKPGSGSSTTATATTTAKPTGTTVTTTAPVLDGDVNFKFVDENGESTVKVKKGEAKTIAVDVNIEAGTNPISALDVQFKTSDGVKISEIYKSSKAFTGVSVSSNIAELRASYATLNGDEAMTAKNGKAAFMLDVDVPATLAAGTYTVGFDSQCKIFKDNTSFNYKTAFTPLTIIVEDPTITTTTEKTTTSTSTSTTTTETETTTKKTTTTVSETTTSTATTTTTTPQPKEKLDVTMWGDTNCDGVVNVADVVVLNRLLNEPTYVVKHPTTKADVTAQGKVNADVVDPQNKEGKGIDPTKVKLTGADSEAIAMYILEKGNIPQ